MFSDTHFHFHYFEENQENNGTEILDALSARNTFFGLDIGTESNDLANRINFFEKSAINLNNEEKINKTCKAFYFSAGIWPSPDEIKNRFENIKILEQQIKDAEQRKSEIPIHNKIIAIGECGLDHHWNPSGVDGRCENDFNEDLYNGEKELFKMQLELAKQKNLPVIIHSRDAFEDTLNCIREVNYNNGIIHCFSYSLEEAKAFLEAGWYISFSGSVTYTKKSKIEEMTKLLNYIPEDRILCETDAPYLAPVPFRGQKNTPILVEHTYTYISNARNISAEKLSDIVDSNIKRLFNLTI